MPPMTQRKPINPFLKLALELGPVLLFFVMYLRTRDQVFNIAGTDYSGFIVTTAIFIPVMLGATAALKILTGHLSRMQLMTAVLVVVFGGLTVWLNDERFLKMKPTILYLLFGGTLGLGLLQGKSYLSLMMDEVMPMAEAGWMILTRRMTAFFFALAGANELVWRSMSTDAWVNFKTFGLPLALFAFFMAQARLFQRYGLSEDDSGSR